MKMAKRIVVIGTLLMFILFAFSSCDNDFIKGEDNVKTESVRSSSVSKSIGELKESGLLDSLINYQASRNAVSSYSDEIDIEQINRFIFNTDEVLDEIAQMENGEVQLRLIEALFTGGTVGEIYDIMTEISEDIANDFQNTLENNLGSLFENSVSSSRSITSNGNIM